MSSSKVIFLKSLTNENKINVHHPSIRNITVNFRQARQLYHRPCGCLHCCRLVLLSKVQARQLYWQSYLLWRPWLYIVSNHDLLCFHSMFLGVIFNVHIPMVYLGKYFFTEITFESFLAIFSKEVLTKQNLPNIRSITIWTFKITSFMNWFSGVFEKILCHTNHITRMASFCHELIWYDYSDFLF